MSQPATTPAPAAPERLGQLAVYYSYGELARLSDYATVVLQPGAHRPEQLAWLRARGVRVLMYLSLGEDASEPPAAYHLSGPSPAWGTRRVQPDHPDWRGRVCAQARRALRQADGLLLDTLDSHPRPEPLLALLRAVRSAVPGAYLLANRGATLLPDLASLVDGVLIEALSTSWEKGYGPHDESGLAYTAALVARFRAAGLPLWGLDYADTPTLAAFAHQRARALGLSTFIGNRNLDRMPAPALEFQEPPDWA